MTDTKNKIIVILRKLDRGILDLLYPPRCPICDRIVLPGEGLCSECEKKVPLVKEPVCKKCGKQLSNQRKEYCMDCSKKARSFTQGKALWIYEKGVRESLYRFKYQNRREYATVYAKEAVRRYGTWMKSKKIQAVIPVPLHKNRRRKRGFNQAEVLAKEIGSLLGVPVYKDLLIRTRDTKPQKTLNDAERKNNLKKAFKTTESIVQLKYILLDDDIYTTGSTLHAAASALKDAGAVEVYVFCISIGKED